MLREDDLPKLNMPGAKGSGAVKQVVQVPVFHDKALFNGGAYLGDGRYCLAEKDIGHEGVRKALGFFVPIIGSWAYSRCADHSGRLIV
ncbi:MAG: hypothetical protein Q7U03_14760 [Syntrophales bacterium]|nr:hypothetical protein [Syntrophales bacterium]